VVCGVQDVSSYEWLSIMSNSWLQLALVLWDSFRYLHFVGLLLAAIFYGPFFSFYFLFYDYWAFFFRVLFVSMWCCLPCCLFNCFGCFRLLLLSLFQFLWISPRLLVHRVSLKQFKLVCLLYKDGFFDFPGMWVNTAIKIGVWSEGWSVNFLVSVPLVTQKSTRVGILLGSLGQ
jgi:hypothetical protein